MKKIQSQFVVWLIVFLVACTSANGASILGDDFTIGGLIDFDPLIQDSPPGVAGAPGNDAEADSGGWDVLVDWVDQDSFDLELRGYSYLGEATIILSDLNFMEAGQAVPITGAVFNIGASEYETFLESPGNPTGATRPFTDPSVSSFTADSLTLKIFDFSQQLAADWPILRFDVTAAGQSTTVPEPTTLLLFGAGLAGLCGYTKRKRR